MNTKHAKHHSQGKAALQRNATRLNARAVATKKLMEAAHEYWQMLKTEQKQARKAFKQAKKAARHARDEAGAALKRLKKSARAAVKTARSRGTRIKVGFGRSRAKMA
jgi:hypothetical protein